MYGSVLLALILTLVGMDVVTEGPRDPAVTLGAMAAVTAGIFALGMAIAAYVARGAGALQRDEQRFLRRVGLLGKGYRLLVVAAYAAILFLLRWPALLYRLVGADRYLPAFVLVLLPLLVLWVVSWSALYWADRRLREMMFARAGVLAAPARWTLPGYLVFMFRQYVLVIILPLAALLGVYDLLAWVLGEPAGDAVSAAVMAAALVAAAVLAGPWMRLCWKTEPLPEGDLRRRLLALAGRAGIGVANILVWRTNISIANGCMVGLVGPLRYIMITDALMLSLPNEEIEAVFAHEAAHAKFRHVGFYMAVAFGAMSGAVLLSTAVYAATGLDWAVQVASAGFLLVFWWLGFGLLSRQCEQQSDLYAVRATSCPADCSPPNAAGRLPADGAASGICEHRVMAFVGALRRIARLNGAAETARGWRHYSIARRCGFLLEVLARPAAAVDFERRLRAVKLVALVAALLLAGAAAAVLALGGLLEPHHPEHPAGPGDIAPGDDRWIVRFVDRYEVDALALRPPQFDRHPDSAAHFHHRGLAGQRVRPAAAHDNVAVADPRSHAVAVDSQAEQRRVRRVEPRKVQELKNAIRRRLG